MVVGLQTSVAMEDSNSQSDALAAGCPLVATAQKVGDGLATLEAKPDVANPRECSIRGEHHSVSNDWDLASKMQHVFVSTMIP